MNVTSPLVPIVRLTALALMAAALVAACDWFDESQAELPAGELVQVACLDTNGDRVVNAADAPGIGDEGLAQAVQAVEVVLLPDAPGDCADGGPAPELQLNAATPSPEITCEEGETPPVLIVGIGGGAVNLRDKTNAAGTRAAQAALQNELNDRGVQTRAIAAGPGIHNVDEPSGPMEGLLAAIVRYHLDKYPCMLAVLIGHSHGGVTATAVASALEGETYAARLLLTATIDRFPGLYTGDTESIPQQSPVFNAYQENDDLGGGPLPEQPNIENWDASGEQGPEKGEEGGSAKQVNHTIIDNSKSVHDRIVDEAIERYEAVTD